MGVGSVTRALAAWGAMHMHEKKRRRGSMAMEGVGRRLFLFHSSSALAGGVIRRCSWVSLVGLGGLVIFLGGVGGG